MSHHSPARGYHHDTRLFSSGKFRVLYRVGNEVRICTLNQLVHLDKFGFPMRRDEIASGTGSSINRASTRSAVAKYSLGPGSLESRSPMVSHHTGCRFCNTTKACPTPSVPATKSVSTCQIVTLSSSTCSPALAEPIVRRSSLCSALLWGPISLLLLAGIVPISTGHTGHGTCLSVWSCGEVVAH